MADQRNLKDRVAIVTGASRGIGREIALHLALKGAKVVVNYAGNAEKADEVALEINEDHETVRGVTCKADVSMAIEARKLFDVAEEAFGAVHILVNNAGIGDTKLTPLAETPEELWELILCVNCKGAFLCSREAANRVIRGGGGRIINLTFIHCGFSEAWTCSVRSKQGSCGDYDEDFGEIIEGHEDYCELCGPWACGYRYVVDWKER